MRKIFILAAILLCGVMAINTTIAANNQSKNQLDGSAADKAEETLTLTDFYTYTENDFGYQVSLTSNFREKLNKASEDSLSSGNYTWHTGNPLPNPAPEGMYNGEPIVSLSRMFHECNSIKELDLSDFNTSNVTNMSEMFSGCSSLISVNLNNFDISKILMINNMFYDCGKATNGIPAVGYAKDAATAEKFNNSSLTGIDNSKLKFEADTTIYSVTIKLTIWEQHQRPLPLP